MVHESGMHPVDHVTSNATPYFAYDEKHHAQLPPGNGLEKKAFNYLVLTTGRFVYASAALLTVLKFIYSMSASKVGRARLAAARRRSLAASASASRDPPAAPRRTCWRWPRWRWTCRRSRRGRR